LLDQCSDDHGRTDQRGNGVERQRYVKSGAAGDEVGTEREQGADQDRRGDQYTVAAGVEQVAAEVWRGDAEEADRAAEASDRASEY